MVLIDLLELFGFPVSLPLTVESSWRKYKYMCNSLCSLLVFCCFFLWVTPMLSHLTQGDLAAVNELQMGLYINNLY